MNEIINIENGSIRTFAESFKELYDEYPTDNDNAHLWFACHVAFFPAFTIDILEKIWINFREEKIDGKKRKYTDVNLVFPHVVIADLINSNLCKKLGRNLFEFKAETQSVLKDFLTKKLGVPYVIQIASFIRNYKVSNPKYITSPSFRKSLEFASDLYLDRDKIAEDLIAYFNQVVKKKKSIAGISMSLGLIKSANSVLAQSTNKRPDNLVNVEQFIDGILDIRRGERQAGLAKLKEISIFLASSLNEANKGITMLLDPDLVEELNLKSAIKQNNKTIKGNGVCGIIVGNNTYDYDITSLQGAIVDMEKMQDFVQSNLKHKEIITLENASKQDIVRAFDNIKKELVDGDTFLFYYAGYGGKEVGDVEELDKFIACSDFLEENNEINRLSHFEMQHLFMQLFDKDIEIVSILDCGYIPFEGLTKNTSNPIRSLPGALKAREKNLLIYDKNFKIGQVWNHKLTSIIVAPDEDYVFDDENGSYFLEQFIRIMEEAELRTMTLTKIKEAYQELDTSKTIPLLEIWNYPSHNSQHLLFERHYLKKRGLALKLIEECKRTKSKKLDLGNCGLTELPDELFELVWLEELFLSNVGWFYDLETNKRNRFTSQNNGKENSLKYFSSKIEKFRKLKVLLANGEFIRKWDLHDLAPLKNLKNLQSLDVRSTKVSDLAPLKNLKNLRSLDASYTQVSDLAPLINLKNLQSLYVENTKVSDLAPLKKFKNLQSFYASDNQVGDLSPLKNLANLQQLNVSITPVSDLSPLKNLANLQQLSVFNTEVSDLSPLENLSNLQRLDVSNTRISDLSPMKNLANLQRLWVYNTEVSDLSPLRNSVNLQRLWVYNTGVSDLGPLGNIENLQKLSVYNTLISDLSPLRKLTNLQKLWVYNTRVNDLSPLKNIENLQKLSVCNTLVSDLGPLKKLIEKGTSVKWNKYGDGINVEDCPLTNPPIEIAKQGNEAILNYWKQIEKQGGTQTINEAKLIIVGEGGTGKTTLFNKLIDPTFNLSQSPTEETQGINIHEGLVIKEYFRANLWDFGGQELEYMTHQFFLTPNAVYVLMMAARGEAPNLAYWFKIISLLGKEKSGDKVSLVIVLNKKKGSIGMPQYQDLLKIYADDFDYQFIEVDLAVNDKRWEKLKEVIERRLVNLPIVKNELPSKWNPIRESLREAAQLQPYIDAARLTNICEPFAVTKEKDQFLMTDYLHQLGSLLHFQSLDDNLMDLIVLSPEWVVEGVYKVLKNEKIREQLKGKFTANDMTKILCADYYKIGGKEKKYTQVDAQKLLQLMSKNNFDICYKSENGKYVATQLLPDYRPINYIWNTSLTTVLQFRYQYPIMPKGLVSRLIVRLSEYIEIIEGVEIVWKKGMILNMEFDGSSCRVLVREEDGVTKTGLRQIIIEALEDSLLFPNRKYAMQRVRQEIESLHKIWFNNITSERIIPCNCYACKDSDTPFTYKFTELMKLKKGRAYCNVQEDFVPLQQLLEGVYEPDEIQSFVKDKRMGRPE